MKKEEFTKRLKELKISKKEFANLANIPYSTVNNWSDKKRPIPSWVESWIKNYICKIELEQTQNILKRIKV